VAYLTGEVSEEFLLLVPHLDGAITAARGPLPGISGRGDVLSLGIESVTSDTWISLSLVVPGVGIDEAENVGAVNLTGDSTATVEFVDSLVRIDGADRHARQTDDGDRRLMIVDDPDFTVSIVVGGVIPDPVALSTITAAATLHQIDNDFYRRAGALFHGDDARG
jgi:hypothetical protein